MHEVFIDLMSSLIILNSTVLVLIHLEVLLLRKREPADLQQPQTCCHSPDRWNTLSILPLHSDDDGPAQRQSFMDRGGMLTAFGGCHTAWSEGESAGSSNGRGLVSIEPTPDPTFSWDALADFGKWLWSSRPSYNGCGQGVRRAEDPRI